MNLIRDLNDLRNSLAGTRPVFVPTMGALHEGHLALIRTAAELANKPDQPVVVSIFVNPTQFGPNEDFSRYPRQLETDARGATNAGAGIIFAPEVDAVYPANKPVMAPSLPAVATEPQLEDAFRPAHFAGVCQVVARLFDLVQPSAAIFGEKDYQQLLVIQAMVEQAPSRWPGLRILAHPTVREADGLAMSSRNVYLKGDERSRARGLFVALQAAAQAGQPSSIADLELRMKAVLQERDLQIDYATVRDAATLMPISSLASPARALIAARLGNVRLIDNRAIP